MLWCVYRDQLKYSDAIRIMESSVNDVINSFSKKEKVLICQHEDVYTVGNGVMENIDLPSIEGCPVVRSNRGGKMTYHGAGQVMFYPILDLQKRGADIKLYIMNLGSIIVNLCSYFKLDAFYDNIDIGVWVIMNGLKKKIASLGIRVRKWVVYHGACINLSPNLNMFKAISPCGLDPSCITSFADLGINVSSEEVHYVLRKEFYKIFV